MTAAAKCRGQTSNVWSQVSLKSSAAISVVQVFAPDLADGSWLARYGIAGRAAGNLRQPNHLASLMMWAAIAAVYITEQRGWRAALPLLDAVIRARERTPTTFYAYACVEAAALYAQTGDRMKAAVLYGDAVDVYGADQRTKEIARRALMQLTTP